MRKRIRAMRDGALKRRATTLSHEAKMNDVVPASIDAATGEKLFVGMRAEERATQIRAADRS